jgi:SAM-dependent methyltransferase
MSSFAAHVRGAVIEYGAGKGTVSALLRPLCERLTLVEPSPNLLGTLRSAYAADSAVAISDQLLDAHIKTVADDSVDAIVMVNVLEHIEDDAGALRQLTRVLKPGGHLLLFVPAMPSLMSDLDRHFGHFRRYRRSELNNKVGDAGLSIIRSRYFDLAGVVPWFVFNTILGSKALNPGMLRFYDVAFVPISRTVESVLRPPVGKNILAIARKGA